MAEALTPVVGGPLPDPQVLAGKPVLVLFLCPYCPYVKHIEPELTRLQADFTPQVAFLAIRGNSLASHPQDGPSGMEEQAHRHGWRFPYLADDSQAVSRAFQAALLAGRAPEPEQTPSIGCNIKWHPARSLPGPRAKGAGGHVGPCAIFRWS